MYAALDKLTAREQTYLLYRYGFTDGIEHPLIGAALHFHLSESPDKEGGGVRRWTACAGSCRGGSDTMGSSG